MPVRDFRLLSGIVELWLLLHWPLLLRGLPCRRPNRMFHDLVSTVAQHLCHAWLLSGLYLDVGLHLVQRDDLPGVVTGHGVVVILCVDVWVLSPGHDAIVLPRTKQLRILFHNTGWLRSKLPILASRERLASRPVPVQVDAADRLLGTRMYRTDFARGLFDVPELCLLLARGNVGPL